METKEASYIVFKESTKKVVYSGEKAFKAMQILHTTAGTNIQFRGQIQAAIFDWTLAMSERNN